MYTSIILDGEDFIPAQLEGSDSVIDDIYFIIKKRTLKASAEKNEMIIVNSSLTVVRFRKHCEKSWQPDTAVSECPLCKSKFSSLKRRHHCRQCGKVVCNKCCSKKLSLPQFSIQEAERICDRCYPVATSVKKSRSIQLKDQLESANELAEMCKSCQKISTLFQFGGFHALISLAGTHADNIILMRTVIKGLHTLVTFQPLQEYMVQFQLVTALCQIIEKSVGKDEEILLDGISALVILCKTEAFLTKVIAADGLTIILNLCMTGSETVVLMALRALSSMIAHPESQKIILDGEKPALKSLLTLAASKIEQVQATALQSLVSLSIGSDWVKHRLVQEDFTAGRPMRTAIQSKSENVEIRIYAAALIANVATSPENMSAIAEPVDCLIEILRSNETNEDLLSNVTRGLGNFSKFRENLYKMKSILPSIMQKCVGHTNKVISTHGLRLVLNLIGHQPTLINDDAFRGSAGPVLQNLLQISGVMESIFLVLMKQAPDVCKAF